MKNSEFREKLRNSEWVGTLGGLSVLCWMWRHLGLKFHPMLLYIGSRKGESSFHMAGDPQSGDLTEVIKPRPNFSPRTQNQESKPSSLLLSKLLSALVADNSWECTQGAQRSPRVQCSFLEQSFWCQESWLSSYKKVTEECTRTTGPRSFWTNWENGYFYGFTHPLGNGGALSQPISEPCEGAVFSIR